MQSAPHPVQGALIRGQTSQSSPLELALRQSPFYGHRKLHEDRATAGVVPAVCTGEGILPRVCGLKQTHVTKPQIFAFNDILDCKLNVATQAALQAARPSAKHRHHSSQETNCSRVGMVLLTCPSGRESSPCPRLLARQTLSSKLRSTERPACPRRQDLPSPAYP